MSQQETLYEIDRLRLTDAKIDRAAGTLEFRLTGTESHIAPLQAALDQQFGENGQVELKAAPKTGGREKERILTLLYHVPEGPRENERIMQDAPKIKVALEQAELAAGDPRMIESVFIALTTKITANREFGRSTSAER